MDLAQHADVVVLDDPLVFAASPNQQGSLVDPKVASIAAPWTSPCWTLGCTNAYEVADPLADGWPLIGVPDPGHLDLFADAVFQSWFARTSPSTAFGGRYDLRGVFQSFSDPAPGDGGWSLDQRPQR